MSKTLVAGAIGAGSGVSLLAQITGFLHANSTVIFAAIFGVLLAQMLSKTKSTVRELILAALNVVIATFMSSSFAKVPIVVQAIGEGNTLLCAFLFAAFSRLIFEFVRIKLQGAIKQGESLDR